MEAALKKKEDSLSTLKEAARVQQEEAQGAIAGKYLGFRCCSILFYHNLSWFPCSELKKAVANETAVKEAANTTFTAVQDEYAELERTAVAVCQELEGAVLSLVARWPAAWERWAIKLPSTPRAPSSSVSNRPSPWP